MQLEVEGMLVPASILLVFLIDHVVGFVKAGDNRRGTALFLFGAEVERGSRV